MSVFIVLEEFPYQGREVDSVFLSEEAAEAYIQTLKWKSRYLIEEWKVQ